jgi:hypothetical protein
VVGSGLLAFGCMMTMRRGTLVKLSVVGATMGCLLSLGLVEESAFGAVSRTSAVGPPLKTAKLTSCFQRYAGLPEGSGIRSMAFDFATDLDPNVDGFVVVSGRNPHPSTATAIIIGGRKPLMTWRFANVRIDAYVFHKNGIAPAPHAMASLQHEVIRDVNTCAATSG